MFRMFVSLAMAALIAGGCAPSGLYEWGSYEASVQHMYAEDSSKHLLKDRQKLIDEVRKTEQRKRQVPPGKYAHIGYLCWLSGDTASARTYFQAERDTYPESARLMDSLIVRVR